MPGVRQIFPAHPDDQTPPQSERDLVDVLAASYAYPEGLWVRANFIASVDGAVSVDGRSAGLSGRADRLLFAVLRSLADVILVGAGTARAERYGKAKPEDTWPQLRAGRTAAPPVAVITRRLDLDQDSRLLAGADRSTGAAQVRTIVLTTSLAPAGRLAAAGRTADVIVAGASEVTPADALTALSDLGHRRVLVEGGPELLGQFIAADLLDELCLTISPVLEGGQAGRIASGCGPVSLRGLCLAALFEDDGFLLARYQRSGSRR
jgi:riboflavin biosynthesis pyrimidine reductase